MMDNKGTNINAAKPEILPCCPPSTNDIVVEYNYIKKYNFDIIIICTESTSADYRSKQKKNKD